MASQSQEINFVIGEIAKLLGDRLSTSQAVRAHHGSNPFSDECIPPDAVAFPKTIEEVVAIVKLCNERKAPLIPYGTGTALEGHAMAPHGGISLDMSNFNRIVEVNAADLDVRVEPGVTRKQLNEHIKDLGLFFPIDPGADASIGGMTSTRASGTNAVRYGTMRENVLSVNAVLPDGRVIRTARRARKSAAGYDITRMFVGAEGTLGVITEVTLKLYGIPEAMSAAVCGFDTLEGAIDTVIQTIQLGVPVARIELMDELMMKISNDYFHFDYPLKPHLFLEFHGTDAWVVEQAETVQAISAENGGGSFEWKTKTEDRNRLWEARHHAAFACRAHRPGAAVWGTDVCVPISRLAECILETKKDIAGSFLQAPIVGHVGDGNFHASFLVFLDNKEEMAEAQRLYDRMIERALAMDGTCTGEHGIGMGKKAFLLAEHGETVDVMRMLKRAIDPNNIMNPGKIFDL